MFSFPEVFFCLLWSNSLHASGLILCVWLLRWFVGRRFPAQGLHLLWLLVAVRLLTPLLPSGSADLGRHVRHAAKQVPLLWAPGWRVRVEAAQERTVEVAAPSITQTTGPSLGWFDVRPWAVVIWSLGLCGHLGWLALSALRLRRQMRGAQPVLDAQVTSLAEDAARTLHLREVPRLWAHTTVSSPAVVGLWRPRILLPLGLSQRLSRAELRLVLLHECAHLRRCDLAALWLLLVVRAVYWFNPLVWLAVRTARVDLELACDETVLAHTGEPEPYGETLLKLAQTSRNYSLPVAAVGIMPSRRALRARLERIGRYSAQPWWRRGVPALIALSMAVAAFGASDEITTPAIPPRGQEFTPASSSPEPKTAPAAPQWATGWSVVRVVIPRTGRLVEALVTLRTPAGREVALPVGITSKEGVKIQSISWTGDPVHVQVKLGRGSETVLLPAPVELVQHDERLPTTLRQVEIEAAYYEAYEVPAEVAESIQQSAVDRDAVAFEPQTKPAGFSALLPAKAAAAAREKIVSALNQKSGVDSIQGPRVTMKAGQRGTIEIIREYRYPTAYEPQRNADGHWVPKDFVTRNLGITLSAEPTVVDEERLIHLSVNPQLVELVGNVDFDTGKAVGDRVDLTKPFLERAHKPVMFDDFAAVSRVRPIFSTREVKALAQLRSGESVLFLDLPETEDLGPYAPLKRTRRSVVIITVHLIDPNGREEEDAASR